MLFRSVVASNCLSGPREIVHDGIDGILVKPNSVTALAIGLNQLMCSPDKRQYFSHHAPKVLERFGVEPVMATWNRTIEQVLNQQPIKVVIKRKKMLAIRA